MESPESANAIRSALQPCFRVIDSTRLFAARDKPYKWAVSADRALSIIGEDVNSRLLDPVLSRLFVDAKIYELTARD